MKEGFVGTGSDIQLARAIIRVLQRAGAEVEIRKDANRVIVTVDYDGHRYIVRGDDVHHEVATAALKTGISLRLD